MWKKIDEYKDNLKKNIEVIKNNKVKMLIIITITFIIGIIIGIRIDKGDDVLSFIGAILGVLGTYGAFYLGENKERKKEKKEKENIIEFELELLQNLLEFTIQETSILSECMVDKYIEFYNDQMIIDVLYKRCYDENVVFEYMLEELLSKNIVEQDKKRILGLIKQFDKKDIDSSTLVLTVAYLDKLSENNYKGLYCDINKLFCENYNFNRLVYTDDWSKYILHLKDKKNYKISYIKDILNWFTYLKNDNIYTIVNQIKELESQVSKDDVINNMYKIEMIRKLQLNQMMEFIKYRDGAIDILRDLFKVDYVEWDIKQSFEYFKERINYESWIKEHKQLQDDI